MNRKKKLYLNTAVSLLHQLITLVCGFVVPRFFLNNYGSDVNGLISSITHFLGFISLAECGVGAVVQSSLYKPLAEKDDEKVSKIIISAERFFRKIAIILLVYIAFMMVFYPKMVGGSFGAGYIVSLIAILSIDTFCQYFISMSYKLLLNADQMLFVQVGLHAICLVINAVVSIVLMLNDASIHTVKMVSSLVFLVQPVILIIFVKKRYNLNKKLILTEEPIQQKWNGLAQHVAYVILNNVDIAVLTIFSTLKNVSVYSVHYMVLNGIKQMVLALTNGIQSLLGNMYVKNEEETLIKFYGNIEWFIHTGTTLIFAITAILTPSFISVYTRGINDAQYIVPVFCALLTFSQASYCLRLPYKMMVNAAGHYKQTQKSAIIEASINVIVSVMLVVNFGLVGVAIGTIVAMSYRTVYFAWYLSKNIIYRKMKFFLQHVFVDAACVIAIVASTLWINKECSNYIQWIVLAIKVGICGLVSCVAINLLFYRKNVTAVLAELMSKICRK